MNTQQQIKLTSFVVHVVCPITHGHVDDRKGFVSDDLCGFLFFFHQFNRVKTLRTKDSNK